MKPHRELKCWSMAVGGETGIIYEIKEGLVPPVTMLPPCSSRDLPSWVHVIEHQAYLDALAQAEKLEAELKSAQKAESIDKDLAADSASRLRLVLLNLSDFLDQYEDYLVPVELIRDQLKYELEKNEVEL